MGAVALAIAVGGCTGTVANEPISTESDLSLGSRGESVRALQEYLTRFGYFPNEALQRQYPAWRPIVTASPPQGVFDEHTMEAVRALQRTAGLPETGVVNGDIRTLLQTPRCAVPDGIAPADPNNKFASFGKWSTSSLTWKVLNTDDVTQTQATEAVRAAFATWSAQTLLSFTEVTGTADIEIEFVEIDGAGGVLAWAAGPGMYSGNGDIEIDTAETWSVATPTPSGNFDLQMIVLHEIGHSLGLDHSSFGDAIMIPFFSPGVQDRVLDVDDAVGISSVYDAWEALPGLARDIGVGGNGAVWIIGTDDVGNGDGSIWKWNGSGWTPTDGGAVRIATDRNGVPWIVNSAGSIYRRSSSSPSSGTWDQMPDSATDIGAGFDDVNSIWIVSATHVDGADDFTIRKFNGSTWDTTTEVSGGLRIAVGPTGVPWITNTAGQIFRRTSNTPTSGSFTELPGLATDIGIGDGNVNGGQYAWVIGNDDVGNGDSGIYVWNEQAQFGSAPARFTWVGVTGGARNISVGPNGTPWIVNNAGNIFRPAN
jgi:peptidoglycan hydrolase-like protein with peptidoglycan-binding domain